MSAMLILCFEKALMRRQLDCFNLQSQNQGLIQLIFENFNILKKVQKITMANYGKPKSYIVKINM